MSDNVRKLVRLPKRIPVEDVTALKAIEGREPDYDYAVILGKDSLNDGKAREYYWDKDSVDNNEYANDDVVRPTSVTPSTLPGRWILVKRDVPQTYGTEIYDVGAGPTSVGVTVEHGLNTYSLLINIYRYAPGLQINSVNVNREQLVIGGTEGLEIGIIDLDNVYIYMPTAQTGVYYIAMTSTSFVSPP